MDWKELNRVLRDASEEDCLKLMRSERKGLNRRSLLLRIYRRYSRMRRGREVIEFTLAAPAKPSGRRGKKK